MAAEDSKKLQNKFHSNCWCNMFLIFITESKLLREISKK